MRLGRTACPWMLAGALLSWTVCLVANGCAPPYGAAPTAPTPQDIPALQRDLSRDSSNVSARLRLAEAYRRAGKAGAAVALLEPVAGKDPTASFYLGAIAEDQGRFADARPHYADYVARGGDVRLRDHARRRLALLDRLEMEQAVRAALANERQLAVRTPLPRTVGVFPFLTVTTDPQLEPLGTALAELLTTDLAQTDRVRVLERVRVQKLLDEMSLAASGRVDPATAARSGRLLGAGTLVQGRVEGTSGALALQALVVHVTTPRAAGAPLDERDALSRIFEVEKRLALGIYDRMGIQLTVAERQRVTRQATTNVQALLALGSGLEAQDAGRYGEGASYFARAVQLDPNFEIAKAHLDQTRALQLAAATPASALAELAVRPVEVSAPVDLFRAVQRMVPDPGTRDAAAEALGAEGVGRHGTAVIVIRRP
jgi:tetratricopeptide (TPR) repeat protein